MFSWLIAAALFLLALVTRLPGFAYSVIDWDESLYYLMAERWRAGHLPYTVLFDNKPIGIYAIFAGFQAVLGDSVVAIRVAAVLAVTATAFLTYRITRHLLIGRPGSPPIVAELCGGLAGAAFILASVSEDGLASNTEIFMVPFTCLAMLLALTGRSRLGTARGLAIGLCLGIAFMVKYVAVFDIGAVLLASVLVPGRLRPGLAGGRDLLRHAVLLGLGTLLPFAAAIGLYGAYGQLAVFLQASLLSNLRRAGAPQSIGLFLNAFWGQAAMFPPLYAALAWLLIRLLPPWGGRRGTVLLLAWTVTAAVGVASGGFYFSHYFIQILPVLCIAAGVAVADLSQRARLAPRAVLVMLAALVLLAPVRAATKDLARMVPVMERPGAGFGWLRDTPARVAAAIAPVLAKSPGATIYVFDAQFILYSLVHVAPPTRYAFPSFLLSRLLSHVAQIDALAEYERIMAQKPLFVICKRVTDVRAPGTANVPVYAAMLRDLAADYVVWRVIDDTVVYLRRSASPIVL